VPASPIPLRVGPSLCGVCMITSVLKQKQLLRKYLPQDSLDEALLPRFRRLDELF
jgi:hypothetical protein